MTVVHYCLYFSGCRCKSIDSFRWLQLRKSSFQVGSMLITRVATTDHTWHKEWTAPRVSPHFDLTLDDKSVLRAIDQLNFIQMKRKFFPSFRKHTEHDSVRTFIPFSCMPFNHATSNLRRKSRNRLQQRTLKFSSLLQHRT